MRRVVGILKKCFASRGLVGWLGVAAGNGMGTMPANGNFPWESAAVSGSATQAPAL
jgi:hypothetical protein